MDIDIKKLPFSVWWQISEINGTWATVAFKRWTQTVDASILQAMNLEECLRLQTLSTTALSGLVSNSKSTEINKKKDKDLCSTKTSYEG